MSQTQGGADPPPKNVTLYMLDFAKWRGSQVVKVMDLDSMNTVSPMALLEDFTHGVYLTYRMQPGQSLRFRIHQVHSQKGDRGGWAAPPLATAVFFD